VKNSLTFHWTSLTLLSMIMSKKNVVSSTQMQTMQKKQSEIRRAELAEYAQQMKLEVRSGKLCPQSISEIMGQLDEPLADSSQ
jgi:Flp pilus assembly protein TadB